MEVKKMDEGKKRCEKGSNEEEIPSMSNIKLDRTEVLTLEKLEENTDDVVLNLNQIVVGIRMLQMISKERMKRWKEHNQKTRIKGGKEIFISEDFLDKDYADIGDQGKKEK